MVAVLAQIHQSGVFFCALFVVAVVIHRPRINWTYFFGGAVVGFLVALPYLTYVVQSGLSELLHYQQTYGNRFPDIDVVTNLIINLTGHNIYATAGHDAVPLLNWPLPGVGGLLALLMLVFVPVLYHGARELASRSTLRFSRSSPRIVVGDAAGYNLLVIVLFGLPLLYLLFRVPGVAHYYVVTFPLAFCLVPLGVSRMAARGKSWRILAVLPLLWILQTVSFHSMTTYRKGGYSYGPTYSLARSIANDVVDRAGTDADSVRVYLRIPKLSSPLPVHWQFVFDRECGVPATLPRDEPYYRVDISWTDALYSRASHSIEVIVPDQK
jgi:hypothetical protein